MQTPTQLKMQEDLKAQCRDVRYDCCCIIKDTGSKYAIALDKTIESIGAMINDFEIPPAEIVHISNELDNLHYMIRKRFRYIYKDAKWIACYKDEPLPHEDMKVRLVPRYIANQEG